MDSVDKSEENMLLINICQFFVNVTKIPNKNNLDKEDFILES